MILEVGGIGFSYDKRKILENVSLRVKGEELVGIVGPNGSGKTTLLKCIDGILNPTGNVLIDGTNARSLKREEIARVMGYVPQGDGRSFPATVFDTVLTGRRPHVRWGITPKDLGMVSDILRKLGLGELALQDVNRLSGGQKQKVMIARALAQEPKILLLDEPTANLDPKHQLDVLGLIKEQTREGIAAIMALHDLNLAGRFCDRVMMLKDGKVYVLGGLEVLNPKNIEAVYGMRASVIDGPKGPLVIPE